MFVKDFKEHVNFQTAQRSSLSSLESECRNESRKGFLVRFTIGFLAEEDWSLLLHAPRWQRLLQRFSLSPDFEQAFAVLLIASESGPIIRSLKITRFQVLFIYPPLFEGSGFIFAAFSSQCTGVS